MSELVCDECGSHNPEGADVCELCGDPLDEERRSKKRRSLIFLVPWAILWTGLTYVAGILAVKGLVLSWQTDGYTFMGMDSTLFSSFFGPPTFLVVYTAVWAVLVGVAPLYTPKENYDFGYQPSKMGGMMDRPFTRRDDRDRAHAGIGCVLLPFMLVHFTWRKVINRIAPGSDGKRSDSNRPGR